MNKQPIKVAMKRPFMEGLSQLIEKYLIEEVQDDDDKLLFATLAEVKEKLDKKLLKYQNDYSMKLDHTHALALRILHKDYIQDVKTYMGSHLHTISTEVHQHYS